MPFDAALPIFSFFSFFSPDYFADAISPRFCAMLSAARDARCFATRADHHYSVHRAQRRHCHFLDYIFSVTPSISPFFDDIFAFISLMSTTPLIIERHFSMVRFRRDAQLLARFFSPPALMILFSRPAADYAIDIFARYAAIAFHTSAIAAIKDFRHAADTR